MTCGLDQKEVKVCSLNFKLFKPWHPLPSPPNNAYHKPIYEYGGGGESLKYSFQELQCYLQYYWYAHVLQHLVIVLVYLILNCWTGAETRIKNTKVCGEWSKNLFILVIFALDSLKPLWSKWRPLFLHVSDVTPGPLVFIHEQ